jgi:hypothetical protein
MSEIKDDVKVSIAITFEYIEKNQPEAEEYQDAYLKWNAVGTPDLQRGSSSYKSAPWTVTRSGVLLHAIGHMHDGGTHVELYVNEQMVCSSRMYYGARPGYGGSIMNHSSPDQINKPQPYSNPRPNNNPLPYENSQPYSNLQPNSNPRPYYTPQPYDNPQPINTPQSNNNPLPNYTWQSNDGPQPNNNPLPSGESQPASNNPSPENAPLPSSWSLTQRIRTPGSNSESESKIGARIRRSDLARRDEPSHIPFGGIHLSDPGHCTSFGRVESGDKMYIVAYYNTTVHQTMSHAGEVEDQMGIMRVYIGPDQD